MRLKGSFDEAAVHIRAWHRRSTHTDSRGQRDGVRLGQYVWWLMGKDGVSWPELFYKIDPAEAEQLIWNEFNQEQHHEKD